MIELALSVGLLLTQPLGPSEGLDYREPATIKVEFMDSTFYPWASLGYGSSYILGQKVSKTYNIGAGVGYRHPITERITFRAEAGIGYPVLDSNKAIQQEVAYTYLVDRHESQWRPIPVDPQYPYDQESYGTTWELEYGAMLRIGFDFKVTEHVEVSLNYRYYNPDGLLEIYAPGARENGGGWWQEFVQVNMNAAELGLTWRF